MPVSFILQRSAAPTYQGPGDIVAGATAWYGLRGYSAAYAATGTGKAVNVRRASDNTTSDIVILTNGNLDIATANTFATVDATATASATASTTLNLTASSSTPHVGSTITGAGVVQPCYIISVGSFAAGTGTVVVNAVQTLAAVSISMQYGLFVTEMYDQSGNGANATQATAGSQPQLLPLCLNSGTLPGIQFNGSNNFATTVGALTQPWTLSFVANRYAAFTTFGELFYDVGSHGITWNNSANSMYEYAGSVVPFTISDATLHAVQGVANAASSVVNVDGTETTGNFGSSNVSANAQFGGPSFPMTARLGEFGAWSAIGFSSGQRPSMRTNQKSYWGTP